jgi:hypothetical protein
MARDKQSQPVSHSDSEGGLFLMHLVYLYDPGPAHQANGWPDLPVTLFTNKANE